MTKRDADDDVLVGEGHQRPVVRLVHQALEHLVALGRALDAHQPEQHARRATDALQRGEREAVQLVRRCRAVVHSTQSSLAFDSTPMSNAPPIDAISSRSASVSAAQSLVSTWIGIAVISSLVLVDPDASVCAQFVPREPAILPKRRTTDQSITASWPKAHAQLADDPVEVDAEVVGQAQHLAVADVQEHRRVARVLAQDPLAAGGCAAR